MAEKIETIITAKDQASSVFKGFGATVIGLNQGLELAKKAFSALTAPIGAVISEGKGFAKQMSAIRSITKITEADFKSLSDEAERIGKTTAFSATEAAKAMETLTRTGQSVEQVMQTTGRAMDFAAAQAISLDDAANTTAVQMNIFANDSLTAEQAVNTMNKGLGASAQNFEQLQGALKTAALGASSLGINFNDLNIMVGTFANVGLKGEMAGTAIKIALKQLAAPTADAQKALSSYGITLDQINPATVKFKDIMQLLKEKQISFNDTIRIFGGEVGPNMTKVVAGGAAAFDAMATKMDQAKTAAESAKDQLNNLDGDLALFDSSMSGLKITIFKSMDTALRGIVQIATVMVDTFEKFVASNAGPLTSAFDSIKTAIGWVLIGVGEMLIAFGNFIGMKSVNAYLTMLAKVFEEVFAIIGKVAGKLIDLGALVLPPLLKELKPLADLLYNFATKVLSLVLWFLKLVSSALDKFTVANMLKGFKDLKKWVDDTMASLREFLETLGLIPKKSKEVGESVPVSELSSYGEYAEKVAKGLTSLATKSDKATKDTAALSGTMSIAEKMAKGYEDQLIKNPLVGAVQQLSDKSIIAGEKTKALGREMIESTKAAKKFEDTIKTATGGKGVAGGDNGAGGGGKGTSGASGGVGDISGLGGVGWSFDFMEGPAQMLTKGMKALGKGLFDMGKNFARSITSMVMGNEDVQKVMKEVMAAFAKIIEPIAKAIIPILRILGDAVGKILTALVPIIKIIIDALGPVIEVLVKDILPVFIDLLKELAPIIQAIMDIIVPILLELMPLIKAILELIIELLPILQAILAIIKIFLPIIIAVIRIVTFLVNVITFLVKILVALPEAIRSMLIAGLATALAPLFIALQALEFVLNNVIKPILDGLKSVLDIITTPLKTLGDILQKVIDAIKPLVDALGNAGGGAAGVVGGVVKGAVSTAGSVVKGVKGLLGFAQGSTGLTRDQLVRLPGMEPNAGLIKAHVGETVGQGEKGVTVNITVGAVDSTLRIEELRRTLEELFLSGRLKVS